MTGDLKDGKPGFSLDLKGSDLVLMVFWLFMLGAFVAAAVGITSSEIHRERVRSESCYIERKWNPQTQREFVSVDYCGSTREATND
jgi:hypothetical protein